MCEANECTSMIFGYLSQLSSYVCPEELRTSLSVHGITDSKFVQTAPPCIMREIISPPHPNFDDDNNNGTLRQHEEYINDIYTKYLTRASDNHNNGNYDVALGLYEEAYEASKQISGEDMNERTSWQMEMEIYILCCIGSIHTSCKNDVKALATYWRAKLSLDAYLTRDTTTTNTSSDWIHDICNIDASSAPLNKVSPHELHLMEPHPISAVVYSNLACACYYLGDSELATTLYSHALNMRFQSINENDMEFLDIAVSSNNLGVCLCVSEHYAEAYTYISAANEIIEELLEIESTHPRAQTVRNNLNKLKTKRMDLPTVMVNQNIRLTALQQLKLGPQKWVSRPVNIKLDPVTAFIVSKRKKKTKKKKKKKKK